MTLDEAYTKNRKSLIRLIKHRLYSYPDVGDLAEDIMQDAWIRASKAPVPEDGNWEGFLVMAVNWEIGAFMEKQWGRKDGRQAGRERLERRNAGKIAERTMGESTRSPGPRVGEGGKIIHDG